MSLIPPETIEQITAANDIVEVIGGYFPLKRSGPVFKALCPFHQEKTPSFSVNPQRQIFKCFGCGAGGSVIRFVMNYENLDFISAAKKLAERAGIRLEQNEMSAEDTARYSMRRRLLALHAEAAEFFHWHLLKKPSAQIARDYLKSRGVGGEIAKSWKLGYAPDEWDAMRAFGEEKGFSEEELVASGLVKLRDEENPRSEFYDRFRARVMFPICNDTGEVIAFSGRVLEADAKAAKYVNSPETMLFTKGAVLFGLHKSKRPLIDAKSAIVCEGQLDLITAFEHGVQNVIAPQGTAFTEKQARILKRYVEEVVLCFDADIAGEKAAERSLASLLAENLIVRVVEMPPGEDPDSMIRGKGAGAFQERITAAKDFFDFQIDRLASREDFATPRGKTSAVRKLATFTTLIRDPLFLESVLQRISRRLDTSLEELRSASRAQSRDESVPSEPQREARLQLRAEIKRLCIAVLRSPHAREWIREREWDQFLDSEPDAELLKKLIASTFDGSDKAQLPALLATLSTDEELTTLDLLGEHARSVKTNPIEGLSQLWLDVELQELKKREELLFEKTKRPNQSNEEIRDLMGQLASNRRFQIEARLRYSDGLRPEQIDRLKQQLKTYLTAETTVIQSIIAERTASGEDVAKLQKQILDLQKRLSDIARPLSPPL